MVYHVRDYGAAGDGAHNDGPAIQRAIDLCHQNGGGRVLLEGGHTYRAGTVVLRSNVELHLELGAVLKGSDKLEDYNVLGLQNAIPAGSDVPSYLCSDYTGMPTLYFLYCKDAENVAVTGLGAIDGNEPVFHGEANRWHIEGKFYPRVPLLFLENVRHLTLRDATLRNSAFWTVHMVGCEDVLIQGIRILNSLNMANCDGIDPDHCKNVRILGCHVQCADDCIVFKNTAGAMGYGPCENIVVSGCTLISTSAAIKFGTESEAPYRNIIVENCCISRSNRGISLQLRDKGCIEDVLFSNLTIVTRRFSQEHWWGSAEPISITAPPRRDGVTVGHIRGVTFSNIRCTGENGIFLHGSADRNIGDIRFENVSLHLARSTRWPVDLHDLRPCQGNTVLRTPLSAVFARNADGVTFERFRVTAGPEMARLMEKEYDVADCGAFTVNGQAL